MLALQLLTVLSVLPAAFAQQEHTLGIFVFHRHGDRTDKAHSPTKLTELGQHQVLTAGDYFRDKYITSDSPIHGISEEVVVQSQINVEAPVDTVLQNSAQAFLQGVYPPVTDTVLTQELANGTKVFSPLNLIPVNQVSSAIQVTSSVDPENVAWLQGLSGCTAATSSSSAYFQSAEFNALEASTKAFYQRLVPVINGTFNEEYATFTNAYSIFDLINVATINNKSIQSSELLDKDTILQLRTLADKHEFGLAYNSSETVRAIAGASLAAQIIEHLNETISSKSKTKMGIQFGAYGTFLSFFGLAQLPAASENFTGLVDYASSMTFELFTEKDMVEGSYPNVEDINVRFLLSNGSASYVGQKAFPLFGQKETVLPYTTFTSEMEKFAIGSAEKWCTTCGVTSGSCAAFASQDAGTTTASSSATASESKGGMSLPVAGVIGALVTLAVILGSQIALMLFGGVRVVRKSALVASAAAAAEEKTGQSA